MSTNNPPKSDTSAPRLLDPGSWPRRPAADAAQLRAALPLAPTAPGVYAFFDAQGQILYIGKARSIRHRLRAYARLDQGPLPSDLRPVTILLFRSNAFVGWATAESEAAALVAEATLIRRHQPRLNMRLRDDHGQSFVGFSADICPRVFITRAPPGRTPASDRYPGAQFEGPFSDARAVRRLLTALRTAIPFVTHRDTPPRCLEYDLGLCPLDPGTTERVSAKTCRQNARTLQRILRGESGSIERRWRREMTSAVRRQEYERAGRRRDDLATLARVMGSD